MLKLKGRPGLGLSGAELDIPERKMVEVPIGYVDGQETIFPNSGTIGKVVQAALNSVK